MKKRFLFSVQTASETYRIRQLQAVITTNAVITTIIVVGIVGTEDLQFAFEDLRTRSSTTRAKQIRTSILKIEVTARQRNFNEFLTFVQLFSEHVPVGVVMGPTKRSQIWRDEG